MNQPSKEWFAVARVGLFTHYTYATYRSDNNYGGTWRSASDSSGGSSVEEVASALDADAYAAAAFDMGAEYVVFTVCHAGFNLLFPSDTMKKTGALHKASNTDAIAALLGALEEYNIPLVLYMPPNDNHDIPDADLIKMGWMKHDGTQDDDGRELFINTLLREINTRYESRIAGIWFDQCGPRSSAANALREGNPNAVVFVNRGVTGDNGKNEVSDFYVSEYYGQIPAGDTDTFPTHHSQINRIFGGSWWACGGKATADARGLFRYTVRVAATEGQYNCGINWACGQYISQEWEDGVRPLMNGFGSLMRKYGGAIYGTVPSVSYITPSGSILENELWGAATEKEDGSKVFLHVLNAPADGELRIGYAADGKRFTSAYLLDGEEASLTDNGCGYTIKISGQWDHTDTVIVLNAKN
ncbi:MAG: alpha-L-fucosidase [Eubacteriales bacterium]